jgi:CubicO group peptidase (beta-lactamase class C family)
MLCQVPETSNWDWNSTYWRNLGAPWGGAHASAADVAAFLQYFHRRNAGVLKPETASATITNQNTGLNQRWGLGWMLNDGKWGKDCSTATYGHSGSTGTLCWHDPAKDLTFVLLTTRPADQSSETLLRPVSELVSLSASQRAQRQDTAEKN